MTWVLGGEGGLVFRVVQFGAAWSWEGERGWRRGRLARYAGDSRSLPIPAPKAGVLQWEGGYWVTAGTEVSNGLAPSPAHSGESHLHGDRSEAAFDLG